MILNIKRTIVFFLALAAFQAYAQIVEKHIATGYGGTPQAAIQNAAEAGLMLAVGSFVDTEQIIKKRVEIRDGVRSQVKFISREVLEASNGSIQNIEVLELVEENNIYRVQAIVSVRIDDLKLLIQPITKAQAIVPKGLFASATTAKDQAEDKVSILTKRIILPLMKGEPIIFEILGINELSQDFDWRPDKIKDKNFRNVTNVEPYYWIQAFTSDDSYKQTKEYKRIEFLRQQGDGHSTFIFTVRSQIDPTFLKNTVSLLEGLSDQSGNYVTIHQSTHYSDFSVSDKRLNTSETDRVFCVTKDINRNKCYNVDVGTPMPKYQSNDPFNSHNILNSYVTEYSELPFVYNVVIVLKDANGKELLREPVKHVCGGRNKGKAQSSASCHRNRHILTSDYGHRFIVHEAWDMIYLTASDKILSEATSVEIQTEPSKDFIKFVQ
jgi:hypothetical protein